MSFVYEFARSSSVSDIQRVRLTNAAARYMLTYGDYLDQKLVQGRKPSEWPVNRLSKAAGAYIRQLERVAGSEHPIVSRYNDPDRADYSAPAVFESAVRHAPEWLVSEPLAAQPESIDPAVESIARPAGL